MYRTPSNNLWKAGFLTREEREELNRKCEENGCDFMEELEEAQEHKRRSLGYETPPSVHIETPGPWTETVKDRAREEERTPPVQTSPITSRQPQTRKKAVTLKFSPPTKKPVSVMHSPPNKRATMAKAEAIKKPSDGLNKTYTKAVLTTASASSKTATTAEPALPASAFLHLLSLDLAVASVQLQPLTSPEK
ncbi:hypothetical protein K1T71_010999 [Dendrolimus kikuchii]|uniref:Uncharacterized protein n=1 Tax=Dendrolimus kikuchii TaxID=765133 RepID=A0ACC1CQJ9_9NEOP|nr:hypothetical protein K1T71_010999 [Dendrolimus kikuchii]